MSPTPSTPHLTLIHNHLKRDSSSSNGKGIFFGILIPLIVIFFLCGCCCTNNKEKEKQRKKRELEEAIHRSIQLHAEICREEGGECGRGCGAGGELPDSVVAEIVRDVHREMRRQAGGVGGSGTAAGGQNEGVTQVEVRHDDGSVIKEPPPAYKPQDGSR